MFFICIWNYTLANACDAIHDKLKIVAASYTTHTPWITREKNQPFLIKILRSDYPILYLLNYYYYMTLKEEEENVWNRDWMRAMDQRPETVEQIFTLGSFASTSFFGSFLSSCFWRNLFRGCVCVCEFYDCQEIFFPSWSFSLVVSFDSTPPPHRFCFFLLISHDFVRSITLYCYAVSGKEWRPRYIFNFVFGSMVREESQAANTASLDTHWMRRSPIIQWNRKNIKITHVTCIYFCYHHTSASAGEAVSTEHRTQEEKEEGEKRHLMCVLIHVDENNIKRNDSF